jgi:hypothetical protein
VQERAGLFLVPLVCALGVLAAVAAAAENGRPPEAKLRISGETHRISPWSFSWTRRTRDGGCQASITDGFPTWRPVGRVAHLHARPRIVLARPQRPGRVSAKASGRLSHRGHLIGANRLDVDLEPRRRGGRTVAWVATIPIKVPAIRYVDVHAHWHADERCAGSREVFLDFKLERR